MNSPIRKGYEEVNGIQMYYEQYGSKGEFLVLIHGGGSTIGTTFSRIIPLLEKDNRIIAVELQAHGHTGDRDAPESFEQDADDVAELIRKLKISKASFLGFSNGGNTAMQMAIRHPELVQTLIIASAFYKREGMFAGFFDMMEKATLDEMPKSLQNAFLEINPDRDALMNMFTKDRDRMRFFKDWEDEDLAGIKTPSLVISGDRDVATVEHTLNMQQLIPNSRLMILPCEHGAYLGAAEVADAGESMIMMTAGLITNWIKQ